jgi:SAM-dependent methyltransferase
MTDSSPQDQLRAVAAARSTIREWANGADLLAIVEAAHRSGLMQYLEQPRSLDDVAVFTKLPPDRVSDLLDVLVEAEVLTPGFALTAGFRALSQGRLGAVLDAVRLEERHAGRALTPAGGQPYFSGSDALVLALDVGMTVDAASQEVVRTINDVLPEYEAVLERGGPLLNVGCGVAGGLLNHAVAYEGLRCVGVEFVPEVAAEAQRRVDVLGLAERVEIRCMDATDLSEEETFAAAFWAQPFFPEPTRAATLAAISRALRPGGVLVMQELNPDPGHSVRLLLEQLVYRRQGLPFGRSAEQLLGEIERAGLSGGRIVDTPAGRWVLVEKQTDQTFGG